MTSKDDAYVEAARAFSKGPSNNAPLQETVPKAEHVETSTSGTLIQDDKEARLAKPSQAVPTLLPELPHLSKHEALPLPRFIASACALCSSSPQMRAACNVTNFRFAEQQSANSVASQTIDDTTKHANQSSKSFVIGIPLSDIRYPFHLLLGDDFITDISSSTDDPCRTSKIEKGKNGSSVFATSDIQKNCDLETQNTSTSFNCGKISTNDALSTEYLQSNRDVQGFRSSSDEVQNHTINITDSCNLLLGNSNSPSNNPTPVSEATALNEGESQAIASARPIDPAKTFPREREEDNDGCGAWKSASVPCEHRSRAASISCSCKLFHYEGKNILCTDSRYSGSDSGKESQALGIGSPKEKNGSRISPKPPTVCHENFSVENSNCQAKSECRDVENGEKLRMSERPCYQEPEFHSSSRLQPSSAATALQPGSDIVSSAFGAGRPQGMEGRDLHLRQTVLEEKKPRVPVYPPLDSPDVMVMPESSLYSSQPSTPSFTDRMIGDRNLLHHHREGRLARCGASHSLYTDNMNPAHTIADLQDTIMALQLQNNELTMCLQQERRRREEAENKVEREKGYIKRLEETIQALKSTRLVIDPSMYRQIAESYIASRQTPVRRTCSSGLQRAGRYEDLVCDSSPEGSLPSSPSNSSASQHLRSPHSGSDRHKDSTSDRLSNTPIPNSPSLSGSSALQDTMPSALSGPLESHDLRWPSDRGDPRPSTEDFLFREDQPPAPSCSAAFTDVQRL